MPSTALTACLRYLHTFGAAICAEIQTFQPDLLLGLAHSDILPLWAAQACWQAAHVGPFPRVARINLGVEKQAVYEQWRTAHDMGGFDNIMATSMDMAHMMAWYAAHPVYQAEFKALLWAQCDEGFTPQRVLILDDFSGSTTRCASFALLYGAFPSAQARHISGTDSTLYRALAEAWLGEANPAKLAELRAAVTEKTNTRRFPTPQHEALKQAVVGSQDVAPGSLALRPLRVEDAELQALATWGIPAGQALGCRAWVEGKVRAGVGRLARRSTPTPQELDAVSIVTPVFPLDKALMLSYLEDGITSARWAQVCGVSRSKARVELRKHWQFWRDLEPRGFGRATRFCPRPWDLPGEPGAEEDRRELAYCALPGRLWAGPYPGWNGPRLDKLAQWGVDLIFDLTTTPLRPPEEPACMPNLNADWAYMAYHADFLGLAAEQGRKLSIQSYPLAPFGVPGREQVLEMLNALDAALAAGHCIYIHDNSGSERAGLVLGCWLVRQGRAPRQALAELARLQSSAILDTYRTPGSEAQRRFVLNWTG